MTTVSLNPRNVFQVLPYLTSGAHDTMDHSCILETFSFLAFCDTTLLFFFLHVCLFLCKSLFVFYTLNMLVFGPSPQSSSSVLNFPGAISTTFLALSCMPKYKTNSPTPTIILSNKMLFEGIYI